MSSRNEVPVVIIESASDRDFEKSNQKNVFKDSVRVLSLQLLRGKNQDFLILFGLIVHSNDETAYYEYNHSCLSLMLL